MILLIISDIIKKELTFNLENNSLPVVIRDKKKGERNERRHINRFL